MNNLQIVNNDYLCKNFQWLDREGVYHYPKDMETKHIFFTLRMIWNHSAPEYMRIEPYKRYSFGSFYTPTYIKTTVVNLCEELSKRTDLQPYFVKCLNIIKSHLNNFLKEKLIEN